MNKKDEKNNLKHDLPIRQLMADMKDDLYAIVNPELNALEDFVKSLYLRVLGTVIQYGDDISDMQSLYFKRIVKGITDDESPEDIMKKALEISAEDIREFVDYMEDKPARFYFALDAAVLTALGGGSQAGCEYLAELLEIIGIEKSELRCITLIAKSIVTQQSSFYDEAKPLLLEDLAEMSFLPYIENYYAGAVVDTAYAKEFSAPDKALSAEIEYPLTYTERKVTFNNLLIKVGDKAWNFNACDTVRFEDCDIIGSTAALCFDACNQVIFSRCRFRDFTWHPLYFNNFSKCKEFTIESCEFTNCIKEYRYSDDYSNNVGGIAKIDRYNDYSPFVMTDCVFRGCGIYNVADKIYYNNSAYGIIANVIGTVNNCKFLSCYSYYKNGDERRMYNKTSLFGSYKSEQNNEIPNNTPFS